MLHGEQNTGKTKTVLGHGCESVVSHMAGIVLGMGGQGAQGQRTVLMSELRHRVRTELMPGLLLPPFISSISQQNCHFTVTALYFGTNGICSYTCSELSGNTALGAEVCWRCTLVMPPSPGVISCVSFDVPQLWNTPEMLGEPVMLCQKTSYFSFSLLLNE